MPFLMMSKRKYIGKKAPQFHGDCDILLLQPTPLVGKGFSVA